MVNEGDGNINISVREFTNSTDKVSSHWRLNQIINICFIKKCEIKILNVCVG